MRREAADDLDVGLYESHSPDSRTLISLKIAANSSARIHWELGCSRAKFLRMSDESFPNRMGTSISPYKCSDLPNEESPRM